MKICAHTLVKNEERYIWFAATSVLPYVDRMLLWDTGSTDNTYQILKEIKKAYPKKVELKEVGDVSIHKFTEVRNRMLKETHEDWIIIADGDEVWWNRGIDKLSCIIRNDGKKLDTIVSHYYNIVGDIYHYQPESASHYKIDDEVGAMNIRAISTKIKGLNVSKPHGTQGYFNGKGVLVQDMNKNRRVHISEKAYLHFTHMNRAGNLKEDKNVPKRKQKYKLEIGSRFPSDFYYPEVFFVNRPGIVPSPWSKMSPSFIAKASVLTPARKARRKFTRLPEGY